MPELVVPSRRFQRSFVEAVEEFREADDDDPYPGLTVLAPIGDFPGESFALGELRDPEVFAAYVDRVVSLADADGTLPPGLVPATYLWWVDGDTYLGRLSIRHRLTQWLLDYGGHVGYVVRPSARRQGHASAMLAASLPVAARLGIDSVLVTCDATNVGSRRVIEANGGVFEDQRAEKLRYWIPTR